MAATEERVATLEGRVNEHSQVLTSVRESVVRLEQRFGGLERRVDDFERRVDGRFAECERRFDSIDKRFDRVDVRLDRVEDRMSRQFLWTVGLLLTMLATIVGGFVSA